MPINESYHNSSFRSLRKFVDHFFDSWLILSFQIWEENWNSRLKSLPRELYVFTRKDLCFSTGRKSFRLYLTQIIHSNGKMLFFWRKICLSKFLWCAVHVKLFFTSRKSSVFCTRQRQLHVYLRLYFIQIVHSYGKMLFLAPNNCASLTFFKEKLCVSARVSKSLAWTVFTCVEKTLSFSCVCCMKMGFEACIPGSIWQRTVTFWLNGKNNLPF